MKKIVALLCVAAMLLTFVACATGDNGDTADAVTTTAMADVNIYPTETDAPSDTTAEPAETAKPSAFESAEKEDLGQYVFNIRYADFDDCYTDFQTDGLNGNVLNDDVYNRNLMVEEALNMKIDITWDAYATINNDVKTQVQAGEHYYDLFASQRSCFSLGYGGYLYNMNDISTLRLDEEWWDQGFIDTMTINDMLFTVVGDISVASLLFVSSQTFNKRLVESYGLSMPYDKVRDGTWTFDALQEMLANTSADLNNDGQMTATEDQFSMIGWASEASYSLFYSTGFKFMTRNADGDVILDYDSERLVGIVERLRDIWDPATTYFNNASSREEHVATWAIFADSRALCADIVLSKIGTYFSDMEDDYGIVPLPKYDEQQADYLTYAGFTVPIMMIPANEQDAERTGLIMEALGSASYDNVTPDLLEIVTKVKNVRDEDSSEMINIIIRTKVYDTAHFFDLPGYGSITRTLIATPTTNVTSLLKIQQKMAEKQWSNIQAEYDKLAK